MTCDPNSIRCQIERIADAMTGFDLNAFASTLLATLVGAGVAAGVAWWLAERDRPRPMWTVESFLGPQQATPRDGVFVVRVVVTNIGDGAAYHPRLEVRGADVSGSRNGSKAVLEPGEQVVAWCGVPGAGREWMDPGSLNLNDTREIHWPTDATVEVKWHQPPRRTRTKRHTLKIGSPAF